jgi:hypothetical protein
LKVRLSFLQVMLSIFLFCFIDFLPILFPFWSIIKTAPISDANDAKWRFYKYDSLQGKNILGTGFQASEMKM